MKELRIKHRLVVHIIIAFFVIALLSFIYWVLYLRPGAPEPDNSVYIILTIMTAISVLILFFIGRLLLLKPYLLVINEQGFEYNPGGVSSGFIEWNNVQDIRKVPLRSTHGQLNGLVWDTAIAIRLKDPSAYKLQASPLLRPLLQVNKNMYDADLYIRPSDLGEQLAAAEALLSRYGNQGKPILPARA